MAMIRAESSCIVAAGFSKRIPVLLCESVPYASTIAAAVSKGNP